MNYSFIDNIEIDGVHLDDYPDFCDAFISSADYNGVAMTDEQLEELNEDYDFMYSAIIAQLTL
jgi:hypothetical protein